MRTDAASYLFLTLCALTLGNVSNVVAEERTTLQTYSIKQHSPNTYSLYEGQVESVKHTNISAQVSGIVKVILVDEGDSVKAGDTLIRVDEAAVKKDVAALKAQVESARANLTLAEKTFERTQGLYQAGHISLANLEQAEAAQTAAEAQLNSLTLQSKAAQTRAEFYTIRAPFDGMVAEIPVETGDMAMPGATLIHMYEPNQIRVTVAIPSESLGLLSDEFSVNIPALGIQGSNIRPTGIQILPIVDASSLTQTVRLDLPASISALPGQFAQVSIPQEQAKSNEPTHLYIPMSALVRRAEMTGVYVLSHEGYPLLRQVRTGRATSTEIEILSGLDVGETLVLNPAQAVKLTQ